MMEITIDGRVYRYPQDIIAIEKRIIDIEATAHNRIDKVTQHMHVMVDKLSNRVTSLEKTIERTLQDNEE